MGASSCNLGYKSIYRFRPIYHEINEEPDDQFVLHLRCLLVDCNLRKVVLFYYFILKKSLHPYHSPALVGQICKKQIICHTCFSHQRFSHGWWFSWTHLSPHAFTLTTKYVTDYNQQTVDLLLFISKVTLLQFWLAVRNHLTKGF